MSDRGFEVAITIRAVDVASATIGGLKGQIASLNTSLKSGHDAALQWQKDWAGTIEVARAAGAALTGLGVGISAALVDAGKTGAEFESVMKDVELQSGATSRELERMAETAKGGDFERLGKGANEIAEGFRRLASEGYGVVEMEAMLQPQVEAAMALGEDQAETTKLMLNLMEQFNLTAEDQGRISDVLAAALANTSFQGSELVETMKMAGVAGRSMGWSLEETVAAADRVVKVTGEASMAGRYLRSVLFEIKAPSKNAADEFGRVGISLDELARAAQDPVTLINLLTEAQNRGINFAGAFSNVAAVAAEALTGEAESVRDVEQSLHAVGVAHEMATAKAETSAGKWAKIGAQWENLKVEIAELLLPAAEAAFDALSPLIDLARSLANTPIAGPIVAAAAALGGLALVAGPLLFGLAEIGRLALMVRTAMAEKALATEAAAIIDGEAAIAADALAISAGSAEIATLGLDGAQLAASRSATLLSDSELAAQIATADLAIAQDAAAGSGLFLSDSEIAAQIAADNLAISEAAAAEATFGLGASSAASAAEMELLTTEEWEAAAAADALSASAATAGGTLKSAMAAAMPVLIGVGGAVLGIVMYIGWMNRVIDEAKRKWEEMREEIERLRGTIGAEGEEDTTDAAMAKLVEARSAVATQLQDLREQERDLNREWGRALWERVMSLGTKSDLWEQMGGQEGAALDRNRVMAHFDDEAAKLEARRQDLNEQIRMLQEGTISPGAVLRRTGAAGGNVAAGAGGQQTNNFTWQQQAPVYGVKDLERQFEEFARRAGAQMQYAAGR